MIETRFVGKTYVEVKISHEGTVIDCGLYDEDERRELAEHLQSVVEDLLYGLEEG